MTLKYLLTQLFLRCLACSLLTPLPAMAQPSQAEVLLRKVDGYRIAAQNVQLEVTITTLARDGGEPREKRYLVFSQSNHSSLVLMQSPMEKGQKVLMIGDDFWMIMPGSTRPIRITPMQKLLGDVSAGDVSAMRWADDYSATIAATDEMVQGEPALHLTLVANRKSVTYQRIELWVGKIHAEPIKAELYVQSEKRAKVASFTMDNKTAPTKVSEMTLVDELSNNKETRILYSAQKERVVPSEWLNPMYLANNPRLD